MRCLIRLFAVVTLTTAGLAAAPAAISPDITKNLLDTGRRYVEGFNATDEELYPQYVPNAQAWSFLSTNIPLFECPDPDIERTYYFRWWTYRKHIRSTPGGFVITEFLPPVPWAGKGNTISCAAGHHLYEGRWLHDPKYLDDYTRFWFRGGGEPRKYSFWAANAIWARYLVTLDDSLALDLLPDLVANYRAWEKERRDPNGLFWQEDGQDGMEVSVGGSGYRATINSYMYGEARAIAAIAGRTDKLELLEEFSTKGSELEQLIREKLWDPEAGFFKVLPRGDGAKLADVRELHGFTPWYFDGLTDGLSDAPWKQVLDPQGFKAPFGPTTTEQRHPGFRVSYEGHECQWNGPSWPYSTAVTLTAMANLLHSGSAQAVTRADYLDLLRTYARSHQRKRADGQVVPWIDENLDPRTGEWLARSRLEKWKDGTWDAGKGGRERGKDYNHSTFCDLVISGLIGVRPIECEWFTLRPLVPEGVWDYFCLDRVKYQSSILTVLYDKTGKRYGMGPGFKLFRDGKLVDSAPGLEPLGDRLPTPRVDSETGGGWKKSPSTPVLGGNLGTCFDISVLKQGDTFRMWFSWRPKKSIALVESRDGVSWSEPLIVLGPEAKTGWEADVNRPVVLKRGDTYHMWYTGQANDRSKIGYATSSDGRVWQRQSDKPVLVADAPWERVSVMCPDVMWDEGAKQFRMWYSGGEDYEPNAIGYATSPDGLVWSKHAANPVFTPNPTNAWEQERVTACQVIRQGDWYVMFYIGFRDVNTAQIGLARSRDGISGWERHPANPIIRTGNGKWDAEAVYKPYAVRDGDRWLLWYNGRRGSVEQIGRAVHAGADLGFD